MVLNTSRGFFRSACMWYVKYFRFHDSMERLFEKGTWSKKYGTHVLNPQGYKTLAVIFVLICSGGSELPASGFGFRLFVLFLFEILRNNPKMFHSYFSWSPPPCVPVDVPPLLLSGSHSPVSPLPPRIGIFFSRGRDVKRLGTVSIQYAKLQNISCMLTIIHHSVTRFYIVIHSTN